MSTPTAKPRIPLIDPFLAHHAATLRDAGPDRISFDEATWDRTAKSAVGLDVECYANLFLVCLRRFADKQTITFEMSDRSELDADGLAAALRDNLIVTFNGASYDLPMCYLAMSGASPAELKSASDRIVRGDIKPWQTERELRVSVPRLNHIDLMEPNPSVRQGLKTLHARLHGRFLVDLPYEPDAWLTPEQMNIVTLYCLNDLEATERLYAALREPIELRVALSRQYGIDLRSKSDAQIGEGIVIRRVEELTRRKVPRSPAPPTGSFRYDPPPYLRYADEGLQALLHELRHTEFRVGANGRVEMPPVLEGRRITLGAMTYQVGIGGLHSTEEHRGVQSDVDNVLIDVDVTGYYPRIILGLGLYPPALGPAFLDVYRGIVEERDKAKLLLGTLERTDALYEPTKVKVDGLKIVANGIFGKLGSPHGALTAAHLFIAITLTGQLAELMLIERAEAAGIPSVSANTDGVVFCCPRIAESTLTALITTWEAATGFSVERTRYHSLYSRDVNTYLAVKEDGKPKRKGPIADPWTEGDLRGQLSKNPQVTVCSEAVLRLVTDGIPIADTVAACTDPRMFVTVIKVNGGGVWRGHQLGRVVRYYWSTDGEPILYRTNSNKVPKTDGARPLLEMTDTVPADLDRARYVAEAEKLAASLGIAV